MKKSLKIILITCMCLLCSINTIYASTIMGDAKNFIKLGENQVSEPIQDKTDINEIIGILWQIGVFAVVIAGVILGMKYMFATLEEKASIKETMQPYIIGAVFILGALSIWKFMIEIMDGII